jgi:Na+/melibiose symporter-like transporter
MQPSSAKIRPALHDPRPTLAEALYSLLRNPFTNLVGGFNWKTAAISAILRAIMFFFTNLRAGHNLALKATLVEGCYAILTMGIFGAATERIRHARPAWLTGLVIWFVIPATLLTVQYNVHRFFGTPELRRSMIASFCFAALGTGFNWFAMRRGALLVGDPLVGGPHSGGAHSARRQSFLADLRAMPLLIWDFVTAVPKALLHRQRI